MLPDATALVDVRCGCQTFLTCASVVGDAVGDPVISATLTIEGGKGPHGPSDVKATTTVTRDIGNSARAMGQEHESTIKALYSHHVQPAKQAIVVQHGRQTTEGDRSGEEKGEGQMCESFVLMISVKRNSMPP